jgi:hypothetical protein
MAGARPNVYNASTAGMTRLRNKGGASAETLYELTNAFVNADRMPQRRPGTVAYRTFSGAQQGKTHGLVAFSGKMYTFTIDPNARFVSAAPPAPQVDVVLLVYPNQNPPGGVDIRQIHFAKIFMGYPYVTVEFTDGVLADYWLQNPAAWKGSTIYTANALVQPSVPNGYYYKAVQVQSGAPAWTPNLLHQIHDYVQPTVYNGFQYRAELMDNQLGPIPAPPNVPSGSVEPVWPTTDGATVLETTIGTPITASPPPTAPPATPPGREDGGKYTNPGGSAGKYGINPYRVP